MLCKSTDRCFRSVKKKSSIADPQSTLPNLPPIIVKEKIDFVPQPQEAPSIRKTPKVIKFADLKSAETNPDTTAEIKPQTPEKKEILKIALNENSLKQVWEETANNFKESKPGISNLMLLYLPKIEESTIVLNIESAVQKNAFEEQWEHIERTILQRFEGNNTMRLTMELHADSGKKKLFGPQEKLKRLIEINPAISNFTKELGLDFDY